MKKIVLPATDNQLAATLLALRGVHGITAPFQLRILEIVCRQAPCRINLTAWSAELGCSKQQLSNGIAYLVERGVLRRDEKRYLHPAEVLPGPDESEIQLIFA